MNLEQYIPKTPKQSDFRFFIVNVTKDGNLIHSDVIHHSENDNLYTRIKDIFTVALQKGGIKNLTLVEHTRATFDSFFDTEIDYDFPEDEYPPFKGSRIRYKTKGMKKDWHHLDDSWMFFFQEQIADNLYQEALEDYIEHKKDLILLFKENLFRTHGLLKHPKKELLWEKATDKFGTETEKSLEKIWDYTSDVYKLMI